MYKQLHSLFLIYCFCFAGMGRLGMDRVRHLAEVCTGRSRTLTAQQPVQAMMQLATAQVQPQLVAQAMAVR